MYPHRIRLRGPWECQPLACLIQREDGQIETREQPLPPGCRMTMPCRWSEGGLGEFTGRVRFRRSFGLPRQIDPAERVWLTFAGVDERADVWVNGQFLGRLEGTSEAFEFDVTSLLRERNALSVEVESLSGHGGLWGEVALEVRRTAFLRNLHLSATITGASAQLHVQGEVAGTSDRPLELYVILGRSTIAYASIGTTGGPFHLVSEELPPERWHQPGQSSLVPHLVRIDLVEGASLWYTVEQLVAFGNS